MPLIDLETFKTKKCEQGHSPPQLSPQHFSCAMYHSREDKRRNPFSTNRKELMYCEYYVEDYYSTDMSSNLIEYLYHPNVYKTIFCKHRLNKNYQTNPEDPTPCPHQYCPYLHDGEDKNTLNQYRNLPMKTTFDANKTDVPFAKQFLHLITNKRDDLDPVYQLQIQNAKNHLRSISEVMKAELTAELIAEKKAAVKDKQQKKVEPPPKDPIEAPIVQKPKIQNPDWYVNYTYFQMGERLPLIQDRHHQFKNFRDIIQNDISKTMMKYITAFLNSEGGVLYVGIDDSSYVCGLELKQNEYDKFLLAIDREGKFNMSPPLMPQKYAIRRIPVVHNKKNRETWIIEIKVTANDNDKKNRILTTYNRQCFVRMNASTHKLDAVDLMEYIRVYEQDKHERRQKNEIIQEVYKFVDKKGSTLSLDALTELKRLTTKLQDRLDVLIVQKNKPSEK